MRLLCITLVLTTMVLGCRKRRSPDAPPAAASETAPPAATPATPARPPAKPNLPEEPEPDHHIMLTRALFTFQGKNGRPPKDWEELVSSGALSKMPQAPVGKRYVFDRSLNVRMVHAQ